MYVRTRDALYLEQETKESGNQKARTITLRLAGTRMMLMLMLKR